MQDIYFVSSRISAVKWNKILGRGSILPACNKRVPNMLFAQTGSYMQVACYILLTTMLPACYMLVTYMLFEPLNYLHVACEHACRHQ